MEATEYILREQKSSGIALGRAMPEPQLTESLIWLGRTVDDLRRATRSMSLVRTRRAGRARRDRRYVVNQHLVVGSGDLRSQWRHFLPLGGTVLGLVPPSPSGARGG